MILEAVKKEPYVLVDMYPHPDPGIWFASYGDSSVNFELVAWVFKYSHTSRDGALFVAVGGR